MIKAVLVDDEKHCLKMLRWELTNHCPEVTICAECRSGQEGIAAIREHTPDVVFLDIEMPRMNGFEMLERLGDIHFEVIFTTAYDQFAIRAIKISALDYLLKPVNQVELKDAVARLKSQTPRTGQAKKWSLLFEQLNQPQAPPERIAISTQDGIELEYISEILYLMAEGNYTQLKMTDGRKLLVSKTLKHFEQTLEKQHFLRVHHSYYVNLKHIRKFIRSQGGYLLMSDKSTVPVSRRRREELIEALLSS
ncbi:MAG: LytTR family DNA-binding domain-containing protein [Saprospiraceae bacterium]|nr:LytTR family DNA-binding domain-containing protein [Saprospiraceae bacterium]